MHANKKCVAPIGRDDKQPLLAVDSCNRGRNVWV